MQPSHDTQDLKTFVSSLASLFCLEATRKTLLAPLERYKLLRQNQNSVLGLASTGRVDGLLDYLRRPQSLSSHFRGNSTNIFSAMVKFQVNYLLFQNVKHSLVSLTDSVTRLPYSRTTRPCSSSPPSPAACSPACSPIP